jgi:hypothetical protein
MLTVIKEDSRYLWCKCPEHDYLEKPPLCINKAEINGKPKGYGYCFSCGYRIDIPSEEVDKMSKKKTICRKTVPVDWIKLNSDYQMNSFIKGKYHELEQEWNVKCLIKYGIGWDGDVSHTFPMRNEAGIITGIQRRLPCGGKLCVPGSQLGLFLPNIQITRVVICEGISDAAVATECGYWGLGLPSANCGHVITVKFLTIHKISKVTIVADNDSVGRKKSKELQKKLLTSGVDCGIIYIEKYKDLREFYLNEGKDKTIQLLKG